MSTHHQRTLGCWLRAVSLVPMVLTTSCISWLDTEVVRRPAERSWEECASPSSDEARLLFEVAELGVYRLRTDQAEDRLEGYLGLTSVAEHRAVGDVAEVVLGPGDRVRVEVLSAAGGAELGLERRTDVALSHAGGPALAVVFAIFDAGRCSAQVFEFIDIAESRKVLQESKRPISYLIAGEKVSAESVDYAQVWMWCLLPPIEIGRLVTRLLGGRFVEPSDFVSEPAGAIFEPTAVRRIWRRPVGARRCSWQLEVPGLSKSLAGEVMTDSSGRVFIPLAQHRKEIGENLDLGRTGRLRVVDVVTRQSAEVSVDLLTLKYEESQ